MSKDNAKMCSILSYLIIGIVWYFVDEKMKKDNAVKFHVKQAIVLMIAWVIWSIALSILLTLTLFLLAPLIGILSLVPWIFTILGIINASNGKEKMLPIIGKYSSKLKF